MRSTLVASSTRRLLILPQTHQQIPESRLLTTTRTTSRALSTQINQLGDTLPRGSSSRSILSRLEKLICVTAGGGNSLLLLGIIVLVEVVDVLLRGLDGFGFAFSGAGSAVLEGEVAAFAPGFDYFGLELFFGGRVGGTIAGLKGSGICDASLGKETLALAGSASCNRTRRRAM